MKVARRRRDGRRESNKHQTFVISPSVIFDKMTAIALLRYPDFVYAAWSAAQNRPLRQQMFPLSVTGGGRICCPSERACVLSKLKIYATVGATCGRPSIHSKLKTGEHSSPLRYNIKI